MQHRRGGHLKLLGTLRGEGDLILADHRRTVSYRIDLFDQGHTRSTSGDIRGDFGDLDIAEDSDPVQAILRFEGGGETAILLTEVEVDAAVIQLLTAEPDSLSSLLALGAPVASHSKVSR